MKRKKQYKFLSILLCFMFLLFAGCDGGMGGFGGDEAQKSLAGTKVLSRPSDYSFSEAVGKYSEYYYNLFARNILYGLYGAYEDQFLGVKAEQIPNIFDPIDKENGLTFSTVDEKTKYYLYDSLRYTINKLTTTRDSSGNIVSQVLELELSGWNWTIPAKNEIRDRSIAFIKTIFNGTEEHYKCEQNDNNYKITFTDDFVYYLTDDWTMVYQVEYNSNPEFKEIYYFGEGKKNEADSDITDYYLSPYYQDKVEETAVTTENYYQDALEYATYLFVLGYDYQIPADAPYFDFTTDFNAKTGKIEDVKVNWNGNQVSVVEALDEIKKIYKEQGGFVGLTEKNKQQIAQFVIDKVIGANAYAKNKFEVVRVNEKLDASNIPSQDLTNQQDPLKFNRNYDQIVKNIVDYACNQAPIGWDVENNKALTLNQNYNASKITDYDADYFFMNYQDSNGNNSDEHRFDHIEAAEYQSMVIFPKTDDVGKALTNIVLCFEYFDNPNPNLRMADSITINVGFRYFNSKANNGNGEIVFSGEKQIVVDNVKDGQFGKDENPDKYWVYIGDSSEIDDIILPKDLKVNTGFNKNIGNGAIDPFASGTVDGNGATASKVISGTDDARKYYKLNDSSSYGSFGTLNESMFSVNNAGGDACDFIEVYFDIVKQKGVSGISYNFKVGLFAVAVEESVY